MAVLGTALLLVSSCAEDVTKPKPEPEPEPHARSTLAGTIEFFTQAHEDEDIDAYTQCLHPGYTFCFSEDDRCDPNWDWHDWIEIAEDLEVTGNMFDAETTTDIRVTFTNLTPDPDSLGFEVEEGEDEGVPFTYFKGLFAVDMHVVEQTSQEERDHWVDGGAYIFLRSDPSDSRLWTVWRVEDWGDIYRGTERSSWSEIKALYRK